MNEIDPIFCWLNAYDNKRCEQESKKSVMELCTKCNKSHKENHNFNYIQKTTKYYLMIYASVN